MDRSDYYFIYPKDKNNKRLGITICVILREGSMFHGISTCSEQDQFSKKIGRAISFQRAEEAYFLHLTRYKQKQKNEAGEGN